jgi:ribonuclease P protein component
MNLPPAALPGSCMQRLVNKTDFERLLATRPYSRSTHFSVHHVAAAPWAPVWNPKRPPPHELSTADARTCPQPVDDSVAPALAAALAAGAPAAWWLGCVVPKRHAKRAVTRSLLKRQVRGAFQRHAQHLPAGIWLVRLRAPFVAGVTGVPGARGVAGNKSVKGKAGDSGFVSAASLALTRAVRTELDALLGRPAA